VTPAEIIYQRRLAVLAHADKSKNVAETCRVFGISRTRYYEWKGVADRYGLAALAHLVAKGLRHERIPARSPNHNAVCERFQGTMLQECWRPAFHRRHFTSIRQLGAEADAWLITYKHRRRNHGDYMRGRTPHQVLDNHKRNKAA
jgi:hypothetical protein